jgi:hypothetical protein
VTCAAASAKVECCPSSRLLVPYSIGSSPGPQQPSRFAGEAAQQAQPSKQSEV